jgi:sugar fermentation stimulation protein A
MKFKKTLIEATLLKRYKRFLADVELADGKIVTVHTANTGSMSGCSTPGSRVWLSESNKLTRKYPLSWELVEAKPGVLVGINTSMANKLVYEAIQAGIIKELQAYSSISTEVVYGSENSRVDLLLENSKGKRCYVEVKNVTLVENNTALFPDAVTKRGSKHLRELMEMHKQGHRSLVFFCVQREDARRFRPADAIDPVYGQTLRLAVQCGVEALAYRAVVSPEEVCLQTGLRVELAD